MKNAIKFLVLISLFITACTKDNENVIKKTIIVTDDIKANTTWKSGNLYVVKGSVDINTNAVLSIEPGTNIQFENGAELTVAYSNGFGVIKALGTASKPIIFTSSSSVKKAGDWNAIWLYDGASGSSFSYCTFEYGGGYTESSALVVMKNADVSFDNCIFKDSKSYGITLDGKSSFGLFEANKFSNTVKNPISIFGKYLHTIGNGNVYDANTDIMVKGGKVDLSGVFVWKKQSAPYNMEGQFSIGSSSGTTINIDPGTIFKMGSDAEILLSYYDGYSTFNATGTAAEPILFTSASPFPSHGDWRGIWLYNGTTSGTNFNYCTITYGGGYSYGGNIILKDNVGANVTIANSTISYSELYGIYKSSVGHTNPSITNVTYESNLLGDTNF